MNSTTFYRYEQYKEWMAEVNKLTNGNYYTILWHGYLNYYDRETDERIGYEVMQAGYYLINREHLDHQR